ncbi:NAD-binding protein [Halomarina ordinaria]|uniref:NAD-binding protein n=1 Tax=Halomarina ordinaria TaxID=3033939 RepID=A0ABD5UC38_9EURY|nr:NAD-binding protein [Halomarina sp. PSRA2]
MVDAPNEPGDRAVEEVFYTAERVALVEWRQFSGAKPTVLVTGVVALLAFVTGLSNMSEATVTLGGPLATVFPGASSFVRFGGVLFAFLLGTATFGLRRRKRIAWRVAVVTLPALAALPLSTLRTTDVPLLLSLCVAFPLLVSNREDFQRRLDLSPLQVASLAAIVGVGLYGTVGAYGLRGQFVGIEDWGDAVYYVIVTVATVGYGDVTPTTTEAQWFTLSVILFGTGAFTIAIGALVAPAIESRMAAAFGTMTASELTLLEDHVVVLGVGDVTASLIDRLADATDFVVVTPDADAATRLKRDGANVLTGDPTDEAVLADARVGDARGIVVGSDDDARDVLAVLACKAVAPDVRVVAAVNEEKHVRKFTSVGADEVINPRTIGGRLLGASVLGEASAYADVLGDDEAA